jgi:hypothetical protein
MLITACVLLLTAVLHPPLYTAGGSRASDADEDDELQDDLVDEDDEEDAGDKGKAAGDDYPCTKHSYA